MSRSGIGVHLKRRAAGVERSLIVGTHGIYAIVVLRVVDEQRRLDPGYVLGLSGTTVKRHASIEIASHLHRQGIDHATAVAEPGGAELAVGERMGFQIPRAVQEVGKELTPVQAFLQDFAIVIVARIAADWR